MATKGHCLEWEMLKARGRGRVHLATKSGDKVAVLLQCATAAVIRSTRLGSTGFTGS